MPIEFSETIVFRDECSIQECEPLLEALQAKVSSPIDLRPCLSMHSALFQLLMAADRRPWPPEESGLRDLLGTRLAWSAPPAPVKPMRKSKASTAQGADHQSKERK